MSVDRTQVEAFLYREARLMDLHRYDEWLALFADDALYWIPSNHDDVDPMREVSIVYADRGLLQAQVARLASGRAYTQDPPSRICRVVSNVEVSPAEGDQIEVHSVFVLFETRAGRSRTFGGRAIHHLREQHGDFSIARKKVLLAGNDEVSGDLTFLL